MWVKKIAAGGEEGEVSEQVRVGKECLEGQSMVVMGEQRFFFFDTEGVEPFRDVVVRGKREVGCSCCPGKQSLVRCRRSAVVFLPYSVARSVGACKLLLKAGVKAGVEAGVKECLQKCLDHRRGEDDDDGGVLWQEAMRGEMGQKTNNKLAHSDSPLSSICRKFERLTSRSQLTANFFSLSGSSAGKAKARVYYLLR